MSGDESGGVARGGSGKSSQGPCGCARVRVATRHASEYEVVVGRGLLARLGDLWPAPGAQAVVVCDENVAALHLEPVRRALAATTLHVAQVVVPPGERHKDQATLTSLHEQLYELGVARSDTIVALGGGVVGDMAGLAAATFMRGVRLVQVPTTLLAMVDAAVGGKVAIDFRKGKNYLGTFYQPGLVVEDLDTLATLPEAESRNGWAEIVKYALLAGGETAALVERSLAAGRVVDEALVAACVGRKAALVGRDERDFGERALLNFGHTIGHAIEAAGGFGVYGHGEAVALGLRAALWLSVRLTGLAPADEERGQRMLTAAGLPERLERVVPGDALALTGRDKKAFAGQARFVLLRGLGEAVSGIEVGDGDQRAVLEWLSGRGTGADAERSAASEEGEGDV